MNICLLWNVVCCQVVCLLRADHSTRGILPSVVCQVSVIVQPRKGKPWPGIGSKRQRIKKKSDLLAVRCWVWWDCKTAPQWVKKSPNFMAVGVALPFFTRARSWSTLWPHVLSPHTFIIFFCTHCLLSWTIPRNWESIPGRAGCFSLPYLSVTHQAFHLVRNGVSVPGGKAAGAWIWLLTSISLQG